MMSLSRIPATPADLDTYEVENTGCDPLRNVTVTDQNFGHGTLGIITCEDPKPQGSTLLPGETMTCHATYDIDPQDLVECEVNNTAKVTGTPPEGPNVEDTDDENPKDS